MSTERNQTQQPLWECLKIAPPPPEMAAVGSNPNTKHKVDPSARLLRLPLAAAWPKPSRAHKACGSEPSPAAPQNSDPISFFTRAWMFFVLAYERVVHERGARVANGVANVAFSSANFKIAAQRLLS